MHPDFRYHNSADIWPDTGEEFTATRAFLPRKSPAQMAEIEAALQKACREIRERSERVAKRQAQREASTVPSISRLFDTINRMG